MAPPDLDTATGPTPPAPRLVTWEEFVALDEDDGRELLDGRLVEGEVPTSMHEFVVGVLVQIIGAWARATKAGIVFPSGVKVRVGLRKGFMPDLVFVRTSNAKALSKVGIATGHPDLVVEVLSPSTETYDRVVKLQSYARIGVPEYWIVDVEKRSLERYRLTTDGEYEPAGAFAKEDVFRPDAFEGLEIPLAELWDTQGFTIE